MKPFSFAVKPKATPAAPPPSLKRPAVFLSADDDEPIDAAPTSSALDKGTSANKKLLAQNVLTSKTTQKRMEAEKRVDNTVYEYDEVWDKMQEAKQRQKEAKEAETKDRQVSQINDWVCILLNIMQPKYIHGLLSSAATRRLDYLRAEEKMMQLEREAEGDEFQDKESFVTQAYKDQMAQVREAEKEEKKREGKPLFFLRHNSIGLFTLFQSCSRSRAVHRRGWRIFIASYWRTRSRSMMLPWLQPRSQSLGPCPI